MSAAGVRHWLSSLNLHEQYEPLFLAAGFDSLEKCRCLTDSLLERIGINLAGHRRRILLHLPHQQTATGPSSSATCDSDDDDREVYDVPPIGRKSGFLPKPVEATYTNIAEMNEIPKPVLPPKKRLSSTEEVEARLGIIGPPVKPHLGPGLFDKGARAADGAQSRPKLCVVYPEKRPPVPARRASKEAKALSACAESPSSNNGVEQQLAQKEPVTATVVPTAMPRSAPRFQHSVNENYSRLGAVPVAAHKLFEQSCVSVPPWVDVPDSAHLDVGIADDAPQSKVLNPSLEDELQALMTNATKSTSTTVESDTTQFATTSSCGGISVPYEVDGPSKNGHPASVLFSIGGYTTAAAEKNPISATELHSESLYNLETGVEEAKGKNGSTERHPECALGLGDSFSSSEDVSPPSLYRKQRLAAKELGPVPLRWKVEDSDLLITEEPNSEDNDFDERDSSVCRFPSPNFSPPPLPSGFASQFQFPPCLQSDTCNRTSHSRTSTDSASGFAYFAEERAKNAESGKPQQSSLGFPSSADSESLSAGFSSALDNYLSQKIISPAVWLNQSPGYLVAIGDGDEFEPSADNRGAELSDVAEDDRTAKDFDPNLEHHIPANDSTAMCYFFDEVINQFGDSSDCENFHDNVHSAVKPLGLDDFNSSSGE